MTSIPESVKRRSSSGPTIGAMLGFWSGLVAMGAEGYGAGLPSVGMEVTVRLFAMLRERAGADSLTLELPDGARVSDALASDALAPLADGIPLVMAVNREYADAEHVLDPGDELALIPPVSGGSTAAAPWVRVSAEPLSLDALAARVRDPRAGAVVTFSGVTREVERLEYEAYAEMAEERMRAIAEEARRARTGCAPRRWSTAWATCRSRSRA